MPSTALFVHVPVDEVDIVNGPGPMWLIQAVADLYARKNREGRMADVYAEVEFTLRTAASEETFRRKLKIAEFDIDMVTFGDFGGLDHVCGFTAIFNGRVVSGGYNPKRRTGHFSLD